MEIKELNKCLHLIGYWVNGDETVINILNNETSDLSVEIIAPTEEELIQNVLKMESHEGKEGVIKHYINEFRAFGHFFKKYLKTLEQNEFDAYVRNCHTIYDILFNAIQLVCQTHRIDFFQVCNDLNFELEFVDCGITLVFEHETEFECHQEKTKLKIDQIALKYVYEGAQITRRNGTQIAKKHGHNSGEKLFQRFTFYSSTANRKGRPMPCTAKKLQNKIELLNSVIDLLPELLKSKAIDEVNILKSIYESEFQ